MSPVYPTLPRLAVRDSFDDDDLSDVDDEVFVRDGRNEGLKIDEEGGVKRPLMAPRRKCKMSRTSDARRLTLKSLVAPCCYGIVALLVLLGLIILVIFAVSVFPTSLTVLKNWLTRGERIEAPKLEIAPCTSLASSIVWTRSLPKLTSEAALRSTDINSDKVDDIVIGFSTGLDVTDAPQYVCSVYFEGHTPCLGGVIALDGKTGETLWTHWTSHVVYSVNCAADLNHDRVKDCIAAGRGGILHAIDGRNGSLIWEIPAHDIGGTTEDVRRILDVYDANILYDIDGDDVSDVMAAHTVQTEGERTSAIVIISGRTGRIVRHIDMPEKTNLYLAPQTLVHPDGERILLLVTGSHEQPGGLYAVPFADILYKKIKLRKLYSDPTKGILSSPILADLTQDGTEDVIATMSNSVIIAFDGRTFEQLWNYSLANSEIVSSPIPGYYNEDDVPDFMVKHEIGPGYPVYYYSLATILDGKTGKPLLGKEMVDTMSGQMSGLSVTVDGYGNDWFLHWSADCLNHEGERSKYQFPKSTKLPSQLRADLCKLRYNSTLSTKFLAVNQHVAPPGIPVYVSQDWADLEYNASIDPRKEAERYAETHADTRSDYDSLGSDSETPITERSPRILHAGRRRGRPSSSRDIGVNGFSEQSGYYTEPETKPKTVTNYENRNNLPSNNNFDSDEDWPDKWDEETKEYDALYDEDPIEIGAVPKVESAIREQRSGLSDPRVNEDTNEVKNRLDPSMDYTNGQTERVRGVSSPVKRTWPLGRSELKNPDGNRVKRGTETSTEKGQREETIDFFQNADEFFKIVKRPGARTQTENSSTKLSGWQLNENAKRMSGMRILNDSEMRILSDTEMRISDDSERILNKNRMKMIRESITKMSNDTASKFEKDDETKPFDDNNPKVLNDTAKIMPNEDETKTLYDDRANIHNDSEILISSHEVVILDESDIKISNSTDVSISQDNETEIVEDSDMDMLNDGEMIITEEETKISNDNNTNVLDVGETKILNVSNVVVPSDGLTKILNDSRIDVVRSHTNARVPTNNTTTYLNISEDTAYLPGIANVTGSIVSNVFEKTFENDSTTVTEGIITEPINNTASYQVHATESNDYRATARPEQIVGKTTWVTRNVLSKVVREDTAYADIEKIFKRESMRNNYAMRRASSDLGLKLVTEKRSGQVMFKREANVRNEKRSGVQRQPPAGILLPSLAKGDSTSVDNSIDLVFATSWLPPSDAQVVLLEQDLECVRRKKEEYASRDEKNPEGREGIVRECLIERGLDVKMLEEAKDRENVKIPLGQMTIYRMQLRCVCPDDLLAGQNCRKISEQQSWSSNLGPLSNGYFKPLRKPAS